MARKTRSVGVVVPTVFAALAIGFGASLSSAPPVSASTTGAITNIHTPLPIPTPIFPFLNPIDVGLRLIDALATGIADVVEELGTAPPIAVPAPDAS